MANSLRGLSIVCKKTIRLACVTRARQVHDPSNETIVATKNFQDGLETCDIKSRAIVTRAKATPVPMTSALIQTVESHAADDNMKGLTIRTSHGDSPWDLSE